MWIALLALSLTLSLVSCTDDGRSSAPSSAPDLPDRAPELDAVLTALAITDQRGGVEAMAIPDHADPERVLRARIVLTLVEDEFADASGDLAHELRRWATHFDTNDVGHWDLLVAAKLSLGEASFRRAIGPRVRRELSTAEPKSAGHLRAIGAMDASRDKSSECDWRLSPSEATVGAFLDRAAVATSGRCPSSVGLPRASAASKYVAKGPMQTVAVLDGLQSIAASNHADRSAIANLEGQVRTVASQWLSGSATLNQAEVFNLARVVASSGSRLPKLQADTLKRLRATVILAGRTIDQGEPFTVADSVALVAAWRILGKSVPLSTGSAGDDRSVILGAWSLMLAGGAAADLAQVDLDFVASLGIAGRATAATVNLVVGDSPCDAFPGGDTGHVVDDEIVSDGGAFWGLVLAGSISECAPDEAERLREQALRASAATTGLLREWLRYQSACDGGSDSRPPSVLPAYQSKGELGPASEVLAYLMLESQRTGEKCVALHRAILGLDQK